MPETGLRLFDNANYIIVRYNYILLYSQWNVQSYVRRVNVSGAAVYNN